MAPAALWTDRCEEGPDKETCPDQDGPYTVFCEYGAPRSPGHIESIDRPEGRRDGEQAPEYGSFPARKGKKEAGADPGKLREIKYQTKRGLLSIKLCRHA